MWWRLALYFSFLVSATVGGSSPLFGREQFTQYLASTDDGSGQLLNLYIRKPVEPEDLYHKVWHLIQDQYFDPTYNSQPWSRWEHRYDGKLKTIDDAHLAIETMLASLNDRYTRFLDRDAFDDEKSQINAKLYGIGVQIGIDKNHHIVVIAPIDETPAARAGLEPADEIVEIDGRSTKNFSVEQAAKCIRGDINTKVLLTIVRGKQRFKVAVVRAEIPIRAVQTVKMLDNDVGYIRLGSFISERANKEVRDSLAALSGAKGIILDLRDNPGGLLSNAIDIANMFLETGTIVSTVDRDGYKTPAPCDGRPVCKLPLVLLINKGSASASEITSGALRDNGRAVLVGETTFGKGLVQGINRLDDGSGVNITIARYLTPSDTDINKKGISPDRMVGLSESDRKDGKGPWWLDPNVPNVKRSPEDLKDIQLKVAVDACHEKIAQGLNSSPVAIKASH